MSFKPGNFMKHIDPVMNWLTVIIVCLIRFPSVYIIPFGKSSFFLSHNIARAIIILLFLLALAARKKVTHNSDRRMLLFVLFYFFTQSVSVFQATNLNSFFTVYKDLLLSLLLFYGVYTAVSRENIHRILSTVFIVTAIGLLLELFAYLLPDVSHNLFSQISNDVYLSFTDFQNGRGRMFGDSFNEVFLPLFFFYISEKAMAKAVSSYAAVALSFFSTFVSGWRTKALMFSFGLISSAIVFGRKYKLLVVTTFFIIFTVLMTANFLALAINRYSIVERLIDVDTIEIKNDTSRLGYWKEASEMVASSPLLGVGLGNYFDFLSQKSKTENMNDSSLTGVKFVVIDDPHNLFFSTAANTGLLGLSSIVLLIGYFLYSDAHTLILKDDKIQNALILSFWTLFIYAFLNPWMYFAYLALFWLLRGIIEKLKTFTNTDIHIIHG